MMKFLIDQAISWLVARDLANAGYDVLHVREIGLSQADDRTILNRAVDEHRVIVTQDTDFGTFLWGEQWLGPRRQFVQEIDSRQVRIATGIFQATMEVELVNDGPVTLLLDSDKQF